MQIDTGNFVVNVIAEGAMVAIVFDFGDDEKFYRGYARGVVNKMENRRLFPGIISVKRQEKAPVTVTAQVKSADFSKETTWNLINLFVAEAIKYELMMAFRS